MNESVINQIEKAIADRKTDLLHLRVLAERADPDKQNEYYRIIEEIVARENAVRDRLARFSDAEPEARPTLQKEIEELWQGTEEAIEVAKAKILEF
ncbi:MAG TPA: hypothetical protein DDY32_18475 [Desulfobulbaceae bacterium]|nr:hypothetical protein [Desulfobulbaceae bacterium]